MARNRTNGNEQAGRTVVTVADPTPPIDRRRQLMDRLYVGAVATAIGTMVGLIVIVAIAANDYMRRNDPAVSRGWAIGATIAVPLAAALGWIVGAAIANRRIEWLEADTQRIIDHLTAALYNAGVQASDVRVYGFNRLFHRESTASQEIDLGSTPFFGDAAGGTRDDRVDLG